MRKAIEKIVIPKLQEAGFEGRYPHFRRNRGEVIDMIAFVPLKYGNGFNVGGTVVFPMEKPERQNILRLTKPIAEKLHPEWKAFADRGIDEMNLFDTKIRNSLRGMGWGNSGAFYYSDLYRRWSLPVGAYVYTAVGEREAVAFVPRDGMKLVQKADAELPLWIAEEVNRQLDELFSWFQQMKTYDDLKSWGEKKYGTGNDWRSMLKRLIKYPQIRCFSHLSKRKNKHNKGD